MLLSVSMATQASSSAASLSVPKGWGLQLADDSGNAREEHFVGLTPRELLTGQEKTSCPLIQLSLACTCMAAL